MSLEKKPVSVEICDMKSHKTLFSLDDLTLSSTISEVKRRIHKKKSHLYADRQALRLEPRGKTLKDEEKLSSVGIVADGGILYLRDLGPQIGWKTVFLVEYFGPLVVYPIFYFVPQIYGEIGNNVNSHNTAVNVALACWSIHYAKRLLETQFVHRFSHGTMPILNLAKNCSYYWGFAAFIGYFVNHPLYTPPSFGHVQLSLGLLAFIVGESGNLAIHLAFKNLRPPGTKVRQIPMPTGNVFTKLFNLVSCPNYTYEALSWLGFSILTQCLPALVFTIVGLGQMSLWAIGKHKNYRKEFSNYPRGRKAILPYLI